MALLDFSLPASDPNNPNSVVTSAADLQRRQLLAQALEKNGMDFSPVQSPWQGAARMAQAALGGWEQGQLNQQQAAGTKANSDALASALAAYGQGGSAAPGPSASGASPSALPTFAAAMGGNTSDAAQQLYSGFYNYARGQGADASGAQEFANLGLGTSANEGLFEKNVWGATGDHGKSWGPLQLLVGGGVGDGLHGDMSPHNQIQVGAAAMWGEPGTGGYYNTRPWNGNGDRLAGRQVGSADLNDSEAAQSAAIARGAALAAKNHLTAGAPVQVASIDPNMPLPTVPAGAKPGDPLGQNGYVGPDGQARAYAVGPGSIAQGAPAAAAISGAAQPAQAISVPGYDGSFTRAQANDADGVPSQAEWDAAAAKAQGGGQQIAAAAPAAPQASSPAPGAAPRQQVNPQQLQALLQVIQSPYSTPAQQQVAQTLLGQVMKQGQPDVISINNKLVDKNTGRVIGDYSSGADTDTNDIKNFKYAQQNGFKGSFTDFETQQKSQAQGNHVIGVGGSLVGPDGKVLYQNSGAGGGMDDATAGSMADRVLAGEGNVLSGLGRGAQGAENIKKVQDAITAKMQAQNLPPDTIAKARAEVAGKMQEQRTLGSATASNTLYGDTAAQAMDTALQASAAVPRGSFKPLNALMNMGMQAWSDPKYGQFLAASNTLVNEYAKATTPVGAPTDSQRSHAYELLSTADSPEKYDAVVRMMHKEIENTHNAIGQAHTQLKTGNFSTPPLQTPPPAQGSSPGILGTIGNALGFGGGQQAQPPQPPVVQDENAFKALPSGTIFTGPDGKQYRKP